VFMFAGRVVRVPKSLESRARKLDERISVAYNRFLGAVSLIAEKDS
jgi:hypothetical protein